MYVPVDVNGAAWRTFCPTRLWAAKVVVKSEGSRRARFFPPHLREGVAAE